MRCGHVGLNNTLVIIYKHADGLCVCGCSHETIEHVVGQCPMYQRQRNILCSLLKQEKVVMNLANILQRNSGDICFNFIFHFLKKKQVYFIGFSQGVQIHTPVQKVAIMHTKSCLPTAIKLKRRKRTEARLASYGGVGTRCLLSQSQGKMTTACLLFS